MQGNGQRQDVAFLALVVAVLAVGVALFVGMKGLNREQPVAERPEPVVEVEAVVPEKDAPGGDDSSRDPFARQGDGGVGQAAPAADRAPGGGQAQSLRLVGVVAEQGGRPMAIIRSERRRYYARAGDRVAGYTVVSVGADRVVLQQDGASRTLVLREPEPQDE